MLGNQQQRNAAVQNWPPVSAAAAPPVESVAKSLRILLVEDDALIRFSTTDMLEGLGHTVLPVASGKQALQTLTSDVDLLMTDLGLPDMHGTELVEACRKQRPNLRVVLATGDHSASAGEIAVTKPYSATDLERVLRELTIKR